MLFFFLAYYAMLQCPVASPKLAIMFIIMPTWCETDRDNVNASTYYARNYARHNFNGGLRHNFNGGLRVAGG